MGKGHLSLLSKDGQPSGKVLKKEYAYQKKQNKQMSEEMKRDKDKKKKQAQNWEA